MSKPFVRAQPRESSRSPCTKLYLYASDLFFFLSSFVFLFSILGESLAGGFFLPKARGLTGAYNGGSLFAMLPSFGQVSAARTSPLPLGMGSP